MQSYKFHKSVYKYNIKLNSNDKVFCVILIEQQRLHNLHCQNQNVIVILTQLYITSLSGLIFLLPARLSKIRRWKDRRVDGIKIFAIDKQAVFKFLCNLIT